MLLDRRSECEELDRLVADVRSGQSRAVVLWGDVGIGKTALLDYTLNLAAGFRVIRASGVEAERELAFAALHQVCMPMLAEFDPNANCARSRSTRARCSSSSGPSLARLTSAPAGSNAPASIWANAASIARPPRTAGEGVSSVARVRKAAAAATPPGARARPAQRSSSAAMSSSANAVARAASRPPIRVSFDIGGFGQRAMHPPTVLGECGAITG
jgi:hypothetical protein